MDAPGQDPDSLLARLLSDVTPRLSLQRLLLLPFGWQAALALLELWTPFLPSGSWRLEAFVME